MESTVLDISSVLISSLTQRLREGYERSYGLLHPEYPNIASWAARMALERISNSDALYHDVEHTVMVTLVGQEILRGRHLREGGVDPYDWLQFMVALVCHDIGYVRGVCQGDQPGRYAKGLDGEFVALPRGITDASLTPYHVDRGQLFVHQRFSGRPHLDVAQICKNIEHTRFPVPKDGDHDGTQDYPGLLRAADLIGQLADPNYIRKLPGLFYEFQENGTAGRLGYDNPDDLRRGYPGFFWNVVNPYIRDAISYLEVTQEGRQWLANLYANVFVVEHGFEGR